MKGPIDGSRGAEHVSPALGPLGMKPYPTLSCWQALLMLLMWQPGIRPLWPPAAAFQDPLSARVQRKTSSACLAPQGEDSATMGTSRALLQALRICHLWLWAKEPLLTPGQPEWQAHLSLLCLESQQVVDACCLSLSGRGGEVLLGLTQCARASRACLWG